MKYIMEIPSKADFVTAYYMEDWLPVIYKSDRIDDLEPYTEPDRKAIEDEVWEFVRMFSCLGNCAISEIGDDKNTTDPLELIEKYSYQQAKAKYEAWKKQKDEIHVGDEIISVDDDVKAVMLDCADYESIYVMTENGCVERWKDLDGVKKTGRHLDEVEELLKKMRGDSDEVN